MLHASQGSLLVDRAGNTMTQIGTSIRQVSTLMREIRDASEQQSAGVQQLGDATSQMETATQSNAALVEEGPAAAASLREQAVRRVQAASAFRLAA